MNENHLPAQALARAVWERFAASGKRHLLITGGRGTGKTTLRLALSTSLPACCGGVETFAVRPGRAVPPERVVLRAIDNAKESAVIARRDPSGASIDLCAEGFETGSRILARCLTAPCEWLVVDEIGFLESGVPAYCGDLLACFKQKRMLAVLRKGETPLLTQLFLRTDVFLVDLDDWQ